jgi:hypothetical protein
LYLHAIASNGVTESMRNAYKMLVEKILSDGKIMLKLIIKIQYEDTDWLHLPRDKDK